MERLVKTQVWGHRGADGWDVQYAPENTLPSFQKAIDMGADGIEFDVQLTKDGEIVICHDERIDRTSDGKGWLKDYTLKELKRFNFSKPHPEYGFVEIPTLEELLALIKSTNLTLNIELKTNMIYYDGLEEKTVQLVRKYDMDERVIYSSFNHYSLQKLKKLFPDAQVGLLMGENFVDVPGYPKRLGAMAVHPPVQPLTKEYIDKCHEYGLKVHTWTVDNLIMMHGVIAMGVDAFITDCPDNGRKIVDEDGRIPKG